MLSKPESASLTAVQLKPFSVCIFLEYVQKKKLYLHGDGESREPVSEDPLRFFLQLIILSWFNRDRAQLEGTART